MTNFTESNPIRRGNPMHDYHIEHPDKQWKALALVQLNLYNSIGWDFLDEEVKADIHDGLNAWALSLLHFEASQCTPAS